MWLARPLDSHAHLRVIIDFEFVIVGNTPWVYEIACVLLDYPWAPPFNIHVLPNISELPPCATQPELSVPWLLKRNAVPANEALFALSNWLFAHMFMAKKPSVLLCAHGGFHVESLILSQMLSNVPHMPWPRTLVFDTLLFCRFVFRDANESGFGLRALMAQFLSNVKYEAHAALNDCLALKLLLQLAENVRGKLLVGAAETLGNTSLTLCPGVGAHTVQMLSAHNWPTDVAGVALRLARGDELPYSVPVGVIREFVDAWCRESNPFAFSHIFTIKRSTKKASDGGCHDASGATATTVCANSIPA